MTSNAQPTPTATVYHFAGDQDNEPGWYYYDDDYPEDGHAGPFPSSEEASQIADWEGFLVHIRKSK